MTTIEKAGFSSKGARVSTAVRFRAERTAEESVARRRGLSGKRGRTWHSRDCSLATRRSSGLAPDRRLIDAVRGNSAKRLAATVPAAPVRITSLRQPEWDVKNVRIWSRDNNMDTTNEKQDRSPDTRKPPGVPGLLAMRPRGLEPPRTISPQGPQPESPCVDTVSGV